MKPKAQRIAIAEACGWTNIHTCTCGSKQRGTSPDGGHEGHIPDYLSDLNAMREAEKVLTLENEGDYRDSLEHITKEAWIEGRAKYPFTTYATASQRAEAFLRTLGLWTTEP